MNSTRVTIIAILCVSAVAAVKFPNELIGEPRIECGQGQMTLEVATVNGNASRIFAKGHHDVHDCFFQSTNIATFSLSACNMNRQRQISPRGMTYQLTVIIQLHPAFITKVDKAYHVKCFYMEADKRVTANIGVSALTTESLNAGHAMPQCMYSLHMESANGPMVRYARVGDKVWHVWECPSDVYGMLVHSCFVSDGQGNQIMVIDENGCGVDRFVMNTPLYSDDLTRAQQETHVFKFADKLTVGFACQIRLCFLNGDACNGISPPNCPTGRSSLERQSVVGTTRTELQTEPATTTQAATTTTTTSTAAATSTTTTASATTPTSATTQSSTTAAPSRTTPHIVTASAESIAEELTSDELIVFESTQSNNVVTEPSLLSFNETNANDTDDLLEGSGEDALVDARERRNVRFRMAQKNVLPPVTSDEQMEMDVNQELTVLEPDQSNVLPAHLTAPHSVSRNSVLSADQLQGRELFCLSSMGFTLIMAAFGLLLIVCIAAGMVICAKSHSDRKKRRQTLVWDRSSVVNMY